MTTRSTCFLFILGILTDAVTAAIYGCSGDNYTTKGTYSTNLNSLISSFPPNIQHNGFYNGTAGQAPDRAYATALCRTDFQLEECRTCLREASPELLRLCPNRRQGILYNDACTLRYSDESLADGAGADSDFISVRNVNTVKSPDEFNRELRELLKDLRGEAVAGGPLMKIAAGNVTAVDFQIIFVLVQCAPDLSPFGCENCLISSEQQLCCDNSTEMVVYMPACHLKYSLSSFYNITRIQQVRQIISNLPPPSPPGNGDVVKTISIILVPIFMALLLVCVGRYVRKRFNKKSNQLILHGSYLEELEDVTSIVSAEESLLYDYEDLGSWNPAAFGREKVRDGEESEEGERFCLKIRSFPAPAGGPCIARVLILVSNKLGQGGFGAVYKGKLQSGQQIAVKRLSTNSSQGELEFKNEVVLIIKLQHRNLVRLLGFSIQGLERLLVYEFVQNGSLDCFIFDPVKRLLISWESRYKIIKGIAKGLVYLHEGSPLRIIHRDLKASNVLLDGDKNPMISDFGMARLFRDDQTRSNTHRIVGTYGYMAPEYAQNGDFSIKSDVFSFGVLVLEIICGQSTSSFKNVENGEDIPYMLSYVWKNWFAGSANKFIDPTLMSSSTSLRDMMRCIHIGLLCVQKNARDRPTMASVLVMLHSSTTIFPMPLKPAFFVPGDEEHMRRSSEIKELSRNEASITDLYPR
ncbi:cysteine-rich receptor-like protein kinase 6 [Salvia hispanica]|uniref:cysteine-rich receptor-like protein kinase 6 n=1 Tax=Salvia hispanica TaxID=49212 RepID=UPI0020099954|nr:cysteine-rich receptor-like protein kinase 6 [Salvia hispanica]